MKSLENCRILIILKIFIFFPPFLFLSTRTRNKSGVPLSERVSSLLATRRMKPMARIKRAEWVTFP